MTRQNLRTYRHKVDKIDNKIFSLIRKRTRIVKQMLATKKFKKQIVDHKRINEILKKIRSKSLQNGIDPKITRRIWKSMIWSNVEFQRKKFQKK